MALLIAALLIGQTSEVRAAFDTLNAGRVAAGLPAWQWDARLARAAQEQADWGWSQYLAGRFASERDAHHDYLGRLARAGWTSRSSAECGAWANQERRGEDGRLYQPDLSGWCYPYRSPVSHAKHLLWVLLQSNLAAVPNEPHVRDFRTPYTHAGVGWAGGFLVIDYGNP